MFGWLMQAAWSEDSARRHHLAPYINADLNFIRNYLLIKLERYWNNKGESVFDGELVGKRFAFLEFLVESRWFKESTIVLYRVILFIAHDDAAYG